MPEAWYLKQLRQYEREIKDLRRRNEELQKRLEEEQRRRQEAEAEVRRMAAVKDAKRPKFPDYSLSRQERLRSTPSAKSPGRRPKAEKLAEVTREEDIYPVGVPPKECILETSRIITRLTGGQKEVVLYRLYRQKWGTRRGALADVLPRSEYGFEVVIAVAFLTHCIGLSFDQARQVLAFFCRLELEKSEIDSLLGQLSREWEAELDTLCELILLSLVVHMDETGWRVGKGNCYTWIFTTALHTVLLYGQSRKEEVLDRILPREEFKGIGVSDCLRIYEHRFAKAQKCWAHFLRKAIKLMLLHPENTRYQAFFDELFAIFAAAKEAKKEAAPAGRAAAVAGLQERIRSLCTDRETKLKRDADKDLREFVNLQKLLFRNRDDLFTFVLIAEVDPTNNAAERGLRKTAQARNNYRTSKTEYGAKRRTVIASVFTSLKQNLPDFSLRSITEEVVRWRQEGESLFRKQLAPVQQGAFP